MKTLAISSSLHLPLETAVVQRYGFVGTVGSGKSSSAQVLAEEFLDNGVQVVAIDPTGTWWGLRSKREDASKASGLRISVIGGKNGDLPLDVEKGAEYARWVVEKFPSVIFDLKGARPGKRERFVETFMRELYRLKGEAKERTPLHIFFEEAQRWAAQQPGDREEKAVAHLMREIAEMIRNDGVGLSFITQAPQAIDKRVFNLTECLFVHQTNGKHERGAVLDWAINKNVTLEHVDLVELEIGQAYVWSPRWLKILEKVKVRKKRTFYAGSTLKFGEKSINVAAPLPEAALADLRSALAETAKRVIEDDPKALRAEVVRLRAELGKKSVAAMTSTPLARIVEKIEVPVLKAGQELHLEQLAARAEKSSDRLESVASDLTKTALDLMSAATALREAVKPAPAPVPRSGSGGHHAGAVGKADQGRGRATPPASRAPRAAAPSGIAPKAFAILEALARFKALGRDLVTRKHAAALSGQSPKSSAYMGHVAALIRDGLVEARDGSLSLTSAGEAAAPAVAAPGDGELAQAYKDNVLDDYQTALFDVVLRNPRRAFSREEIAEEAGRSAASSAFMGALAGLRALDLVDYEQGNVRLAEGVR